MLNALMFHELAREPRDHSTVEPLIFDQCLKIIAEKGLPVMTISEGGLTRESGLAVSLTFDDGKSSDFEIAFPKLTSYGYKATFFIITAEVGRPGYMTWPQIRSMAEAGMEIGSHSHTHPFLTRLAPGEADLELTRSKQEIEDHLGMEARSLSFPNGDYNGRIFQRALEIGYKNVCLSRPGLNDLPLRGDVGIARNALHRMMTLEILPEVIVPAWQRRIRMVVSYHSRAALRGVLGVEGYLRVREALWSALNPSARLRP